MHSYFSLPLVLLGLIIAVPTLAKNQKSKPPAIAPVTFKTWGEAIDPDQDSQFVFGRDSLAIVVAAGDHALGIERKQMNAPRLLRDVKGDLTLEVRVIGNYPQNTTTKVPGRPPFHGAGIVLWQDQNNYIRLERASVFLQGKQRNYINFEKRENGQFNFGAKERSGRAIKLSETLQGVSLRLERHRNKVVARYSVNGKQWAPVGEFTAQWATALKVGFVAGHNTDKGFSPTFEQLKLTQP